MRRSGGQAVGNRNDRIEHQLAGAVVSDVAAAVGLFEGGAHGSRIDQNVRPIGVDPQREDVGMLEDEQILVVGVLRQRMLQDVRLVIGNRPQGANPQHGSTF